MGDTQYFSNRDLSSRFFLSLSCPRNAPRRLPEWIPRAKLSTKRTIYSCFAKSLTKESSRYAPTDFKSVYKKKKIFVLKRIFIINLISSEKFKERKRRKYRCFGSVESISRPFRWKRISGMDESPTNEQATRWNHRLIKGLPVLPTLASLKGPDAWKRTSRSWPLTQSRITTCHRGNRHRRCTPTYGGTRTRERKEDEKKKKEDRRIDIGFSSPFEVGKPSYVISSSWSEQS